MIDLGAFDLCQEEGLKVVPKRGWRNCMGVMEVNPVIKNKKVLLL